MKILAVNSSDSILSVAVNVRHQVAAKEKVAERNHNKFVLVMIRELLAEAQLSLKQLDAVAFGQGPGSFTGLRISAGVAQGIALGLDIPVLPVSCLSAIAQRQNRPKTVSVIDAKRQQIYWACYSLDSSGVVKLLENENLTEVDDLRLSDPGWHAAGSGWDLHCKQIQQQNLGCLSSGSSKQQPRAREISVIGMNGLIQGLGKPAYLAIPNYLSPYISRTFSLL